MLNRAAVRIIQDVRQWSSSKAGPGSAELDWRPGGDAAGSLSELLEARHDWLASPDPALWRSGDAHRLLIEAAAARLTDTYRLTEHAAVVLQTLFDFLEDTDRFHPASMRVATLRKELSRAAAKFPAAMADEPTWLLAKRVFTAAEADGVDTTDGEAVDRWAAAFSAGPVERRRAVLGVLLDKQPELLTARFLIRGGQVVALAPGSAVPARFRRHDPDTCTHCRSRPAGGLAALPPAGELAAAARESTLLRNMVTCGHWAAPGRPVSKTAFPSQADTRALAAALGVSLRDSVRDPSSHPVLLRAWRQALDADVLRLHRSAVVAGSGLAALEEAMADTADPDRLLQVWCDLADIAVIGPTPLPAKGTVMPKLEEFSRLWGPRALGELYRNGGQAVVGDLADTMVTNFGGPRTNEVVEAMIGVSVRGSLFAATEAGILTVTVPPDAGISPELARMVDDSGTILGEPVWSVAPVQGARTELTPLGRYFVGWSLREQGHAPLPEPVPVP